MSFPMSLSNTPTWLDMLQISKTGYRYYWYWCISMFELAFTASF